MAKSPHTPEMKKSKSFFMRSSSSWGVGWMSDRNGARRRTASRRAAPYLGTICLEVQKSAWATQSRTDTQPPNQRFFYYRCDCELLLKSNPNFEEFHCNASLRKYLVFLFCRRIAFPILAQHAQQQSGRLVSWISIYLMPQETCNHF